MNIKLQEALKHEVLEMKIKMKRIIIKADKVKEIAEEGLNYGDRNAQIFHQEVLKIMKDITDFVDFLSEEPKIPTGKAKQ